MQSLKTWKQSQSDRWQKSGDEGWAWNTYGERVQEEFWEDKNGQYLG